MKSTIFHTEVLLKRPSSYLILFVHNLNKLLALIDWSPFQSCFNFGVKIVKNPDFYDFCKLKKLFLKCNTFLAITINTFLHTWLMLLLHFAILHLYIKFTFAKKATLLLLHIFHLRNFVNRSLQFSFSLLAIWVLIVNHMTKMSLWSYKKRLMVLIQQKSLFT